MKYTVSHSCGHEQVHDITGPDTRGQRQRTADRYARQDCTDCRALSREDAQAHAAAEAAEAAAVTMPDLTGTPRQVAWAQTLRQRALAQLVGQPAAVEAAAAQDTASWWIDHRDDLPAALRSQEPTRKAVDQDHPSDTDQWELLDRKRKVFDAAPQIHTPQQQAVAHLLLTALRRFTHTDNPADRDPIRRAEIKGEIKVLRRVLIEQLAVPLGMPLAEPLGVPDGTDWRSLTDEQRDMSEYLWLCQELDRYETYRSRTDPAARLQRAWMDWTIASNVADSGLNTLAAEAAAANASEAPRRLSFQQIADAIPAERGRSWAQWLVNRGRGLA